MSSLGKQFQYLLYGLFLSLTNTVQAADDFKDIEITTIPAADNIYMLTGKGGNIGVSVGNDGVFMIDDQFAPLTDKILTAISKLSDKPVKFVINTHWHPDHTGGNENIGKKGAIIVAHNNVRKRLSVENFIALFNMQSSPMPADGLPDITFTDNVTFYFNDNDIRVFHVKDAHTDGDSIIQFSNANVIHTGDTYFAGMYPFIDSTHGGSIDGFINAVEQVLSLSDENTVIIPGHGAISNKQELIAYHNMLQTIRDTMASLLEKKPTLEQVQASAPTKAFDKDYGNGFIKNETFVKMLYEDMTLDRN